MYLCHLLQQSGCKERSSSKVFIFFIFYCISRIGWWKYFYNLGLHIKCLCIVAWFIESQAGCWWAIFDLGKLYLFYILFVVLLVFPSNRLVIVLVSCTWIGWEFFCISLWSSSTDACGVISLFLLVTRKKARLRVSI